MQAGTATPDEWARRMSGAADLSSDGGPWSSALLRHWAGTSPHMDQPPLNHHYMVQHLGGAKCVRRHKDGASLSTLVELGAITVVPVGTEFKWHTSGPIEFAHLYLSPSHLVRAAQRFGQTRSFSVIDTVGAGHRLLSTLFTGMLGEISRGKAADSLYLDCMLDTFVFTLLREHCTLSIPDRPRETMTRFRLARVIEYIDAHLSSPIELADLVDIDGISTFHFVRAFKNAAGTTPYQFVLRRRIERAMTLLRTSDARIDAIAIACGFTNTVHFSKTFSRFVKATPTRFRREHC